MRKKFFILIITFLLLAAWGETQLYSGLNEREANEIMYVLLSNNIACSKVSQKDGFVIMVDSVHLARAIKLVDVMGLPHEKFVNLGDVFAQQGLVASPTEEKARFIHAISQELSETISNIDGVLVARVHIVLPIENIVSDVLFPSSASVFIKYRYGADVAAMVPKIKLLVLNSVVGLKENNISIILFESDILQLDAIPLQAVSMFWIYVIVGLVLLVLLLGGGGLFWIWHSRSQITSRLRESKINPMQTMKTRMQASEQTPSAPGAQASSDTEQTAGNPPSMSQASASTTAQSTPESASKT